ncbi:MAG: radical SAM protein [Candidatus Hodarchaeales archaeon]|jgi:DNA repair photolyase
MVFLEIEGIAPKKAKSILTPTKGSLKSFTHSLNPYSGCLYDCSYCYVPKGFELTIGKWAKNNWGKWVEPKINAPLLLKKQLRQMKEKLSFIKIYIGSVTDPYQTIEKKYQITKSLLKVFLDYPVSLVTVQTRSPLIIRDIELLNMLNKKLKGNLTVNMTIGSNDELVRKRYESKSASYHSRRLVLKKLTDSGIKTNVSISPVLPCDPVVFAKQIAEITNKVSFEPIIVDSRGERYSKGPYIGALTREKFYEVLPKEERKYFTMQFYNRVVEIFEEEMGKDRIVDRQVVKNLTKKESSPIISKNKCKTVSLTKFMVSS